MLLDQRQYKRFYRLFDYLISYAAARFDTLPDLFDARGRMREDEVYRVAQRIWGNEGNRSLIADYIQENPYGLNRNDLREVESWEDAICQRFPIVRIGRDVLFLYGGHAFAVRGLSREIDEVTGPLPVFADTVIMPFDGLITYCTAITSYSIEIGSNMRLSLTEETAEYCATGKLVRTARDFARMLPAAREEAAREEAERFAHKTELDMNANELADGQHEGALAGLDWEKREEAVGAYLREQMSLTHGMLEQQFDEWCDKGKPAETLGEVLARDNKREIIACAKAFGMRRGLSSLNKAQLIYAVTDYLKSQGPLFVSRARAYGMNTLEALRRACEAGGKVTYSDKSLSHFDDVPMPCYPATLLYHDREAGTYVLVAPLEVRMSLEECNWDAEIEQTKAIEEVIRQIEALVDFRGVVEFDDAVGELDEELLGRVDDFELIAVMQRRAMWQSVGFDLVEMDDDLYFVHPFISEDAELRADGIPENPSVIHQFLAEQSGKAPRHLKDLEGTKDIIEWMARRQSTRDLAAYLDAHVPNGCDDYFFANTIIEEVIDGSRDFLDINYILNRLHDEGFMATEAQLNRLLELIRAVANDVPKWANNGWSPSELLATC